MVRTKANASGCSAPSAASRTSYSKAPRKMYGRQGNNNTRVDLGSPSSKKDKYTGGNSVCPRSTPKWQKPISTFFDSNSPAQEEQNSENEKENQIPTKEKSDIDAFPTQKFSDISSSSGKQVIRNECIATMNDEISEDA